MKTLIPKFLISVLILAGVLAFSGPDPGQAASRSIHRVRTQDNRPVDLYRDYLAVVIGVGKYQNLPNLPGAVRDAREVSQKLRELGFSVVLYLDPDSDRLKKILNNIPYSVGRREDRALLIYYAGHGETETYADGTKLGYITAVDCPLPGHDPAGFAGRSVSMEDVESLAKKIKCRHVLMAFDSCFSGALLNTSRAVPRGITEKIGKPVRMFITAGNENEEVPDQSVFKTAFLEGIAGKADLDRDGYVIGSELGLYIQKKVDQYSQGAQHPQYGKIRSPMLAEGDFVFIPPGTPEPDPEPAMVPPPQKPKPSSDPVASLPPQTATPLAGWFDQTKLETQDKFHWQRKLEEMKAYYRNALAFEETSADPARIAANWEFFLESYKQDNPYSDDDEVMRIKAMQRVNHWLILAGRQSPSEDSGSSSSVASTSPGTEPDYGSAVQHQYDTAYYQFKNLCAKLPRSNADWRQVSAARKSLLDFRRGLGSGSAGYLAEISQLTTCLDILQFRLGFRMAVDETRVKSLADHLRGSGELRSVWRGWARTMELDDWAGLLLQAHAVRRAQGRGCDAGCTRTKLARLFGSKESEWGRLNQMIEAFIPSAPGRPVATGSGFEPHHASPEKIEGGDGGDGGGGGGGV